MGIKWEEAQKNEFTLWKLTDRSMIYPISIKKRYCSSISTKDLILFIKGI